MNDVVEELRLELVMAAEGAALMAEVQRRSKTAGLTASVFERVDIGTTRAVLSCARPRSPDSH